MAFKQLLPIVTVHQRILNDSVFVPWCLLAHWPHVDNPRLCWHSYQYTMPAGIGGHVPNICVLAAAAQMAKHRNAEAYAQLTLRFSY